MKYFTSLLLVFFLFQSTAAQSNGLSDKQVAIDQLMQHSYDYGIFNGTILVSVDGKEIYSNALGYADKNSGRKLNKSTSVYLASVSKQFTTMAIMILKEQNKLSYDNTLADYFPEFPEYAKEVTIKQMMQHTSGIPDHYRFGIYKPGLSNEDVYKLLLDQPLDFKSGERFSYSNGGYVLLSMIVAKVAEQPFHEFMKTQIFDPLGMDNTLVYDTSEPKIKDRAVGYNANGELDDYTIFTTGAGGMYSNIYDLHKWDQALYTEKLVSKETLEEAFTPAKLNNGEYTQYGFGWGVQDNDGKKSVQHSGGLAGYRTFIRRNLYDNSGYIVLTNHGNQTNLTPILRALDAILADESYEMPRVPLSSELSKLLSDHKAEKAISKIETLLNSNSKKYEIDEFGINSLGYDYFGEGDLKTALAIFEFNVAKNPNASNPYDSLGEVQLAMGDTIQAVNNYKKSYKLDPNNTNAIDVLKRIGVDTSEMTKPLEVDAKILDTYVGKYELQPNFILSVTRDENRLFVQATGQGKIEVFPMSDIKFYSKIVDAQITFQKNSNGKISSLTLHQNGDFNAPKIE
ncbi:serine hydrolase [Winogradskyella tangerina]|uniref:serine hydrolase n=1 Tax=Winogradskyella tangerina TaxID=2023240 RepID=UPI000DBE3562|nr:serine hydrolase [Winogradskyella tangerina]